MSTTSKKYFDKKFKTEIWSRFIKNIAAIKSEKDLHNILSKLFTPQELIMMEKRLAILHLLNIGKSYRQISEIADIHYDTISFVKNQYAPKLKKSIKKEKQREEDLFGWAQKDKYKQSIFHHRPNRFR